MKKEKAISKYKIFMLGGLALTVGLGLTAMAQGRLTFEKVLEMVQALGVVKFETHPYLEKLEQNELKHVVNTAEVMFKRQMATEPSSRDAHAKGHGCVTAEFRISESIPLEFRRGLFSNGGQKYEALVRLSNGSGTTQSDQIPDGRGFAIKLLNVDKSGMNVLGTGSTQDFMMVNGPRFFVGSVKDYARMQNITLKYKSLQRFFLEKAILEGLQDAEIPAEAIKEGSNYEIIEAVVDALTETPLNRETVQDQLSHLIPDRALDKALPSVLNKLQQMSRGQAPLELRNAVDITGKKVTSMLSESYFSMSSYLLKENPTQDGAEDIAVKYLVKPIECSTGAELANQTQGTSAATDSFLAEDLTAKLKNQSVCFDFYIQPLPRKQVNLVQTQLVEDPRLDYGTEPVRIARISIPTQDLTKANRNFCENLSFNPWQAMSNHRPLGALNRVRKVAVTASSIRRHLFNSSERLEPKSSQELYSEQGN